MDAVKIFHQKVVKDNTITEMTLWKVAVSKDKPYGLKYSLVFVVDGKRIIAYDNAEGKGDHRHYGKHEEMYVFTDVGRLLADFFEDISKWKEKRDEDKTDTY